MEKSRQVFSKAKAQLVAAFVLGAGAAWALSLVQAPNMTPEGRRQLAEAQQTAQAALTRVSQAEATRDEFRRQLASAIIARDGALRDAALYKEQKLAAEQERDAAQQVLAGMQPASGAAAAKASPQDQILSYLFAHDSGGMVYVSEISSATGMQQGLVNYYLQELIGKAYVTGDKNSVKIAENGRSYWVKRIGME
ncbi:MAG: hypothetical protein EBV03_06425 [Proteobacteria bacterium]|nr:hypothetical protein [Pseudomonadota bacterium]